MSNSNIGSSMTGNIEVICSESLLCTGCNLGVILNDNDINNEAINNYVIEYGTFVCGGLFSCQSSVSYCPNYKIVVSCDGVSIYCAKYDDNYDIY